MSWEGKKICQTGALDVFSCKTRVAPLTWLLLQLDHLAFRTGLFGAGDISCPGIASSQSSVDAKRRPGAANEVRLRGEEAKHGETQNGIADDTWERCQFFCVQRPLVFVARSEFSHSQNGITVLLMRRRDSSILRHWVIRVPAKQHFYCHLPLIIIVCMCAVPLQTIKTVEQRSSRARSFWRTSIHVGHCEIPWSKPSL